MDGIQVTILIERRSRGDLIEVFKAKNGFSDMSGVLEYLVLIDQVVV